MVYPTVKNIKDQTLNNLYLDLCRLSPRESTDRRSDLEHLSSLNGSFSLYSISRNGATTLLREFARDKKGSILDCQNYYKIRDLNEDLALESSPLILDEATALFFQIQDRGRGSRKVMDYLEELSSIRPVGLRLHPECKPYKDELRARGFEIVDLKKIPYHEFRAIFDQKFKGLDFTIPEMIIESAHTNYDALTKSTLFIAEAFRLLAIDPTRRLTEREVKLRVENKYKEIYSPTNYS